MSSSSQPETIPARRPGHTLASLVLGLPLAAAVLALFYFGPLRNTPAFRYIMHPVQWVEVAFFCCGLAALLIRTWQVRQEQLACEADILPRWDGKPVPAGRAGELLASVSRQPESVQRTYFVRRIRAAVEFICRRGSAADIDDQLRSLAEGDAIAQENGGGLVRFITWAIPILGFLGTVLGITTAIAGVTPEQLEESMSSVTDGLAEAFDSTALALGLTMIVMFLTYLVDRLEQALLGEVDQLVESQIAHRFERESIDSAPFVSALQQHTEALTGAVEGLVRKQAEIWAAALGEPDRRLANLIIDVREQLTAALGQALDQTVQAYAQRLAGMEEQTVRQSGALLQQLAHVADAVKETGHQQQQVMVRIADGITGHASALTKLQDDAANLVHLQAVLHQNLAALASASSFEEAVHSLTAAVHLLTVRVSGGSPKPTYQGRAA